MIASLFMSPANSEPEENSIIAKIKEGRKGGREEGEIYRCAAAAAGRILLSAIIYNFSTAVSSLQSY